MIGKEREMTKIAQQYMNYFLSAIILFILLGVYPSIRFEEQIVSVLDRLHEVGYKKSQLFYQSEFQTVNALEIKKDNQKLILNFKKPHYLFLFFNEEVESKYNETLPNEVELKISN